MNIDVTPATLETSSPTSVAIDVEGLILPNDSLSNYQLIEAAKKLKIKHFRGVFVRDQLPKKPRAVECGILNTGDSSTNGFHWICWSKLGSKKVCFDSYGLPPPVELVQYLKSPVYYNSERVQFGNTVFCGHLCLYVLKRLDEGVTSGVATEGVLHRRCLGEDFQEIINGLY